jgi:hypothetical protein
MEKALPKAVGRDTVHRTLLLVVGGWAVGGERQWRGKVVSGMARGGVDKGEKRRGKRWKGRQRRILEHNYGGASFEATDRCSPAKLPAGTVPLLGLGDETLETKHPWVLGL